MDNFYSLFSQLKKSKILIGLWIGLENVKDPYNVVVDGLLVDSDGSFS